LKSKRFRSRNTWLLFS